MKDLAGDETLQYIYQLESEQNKLHRRLQEVSSQLRTSKVL